MYICINTSCDVEAFTNINRIIKDALRNINQCPLCKEIGYHVLKGDPDGKPERPINMRTKEELDLSREPKLITLSSELDI